jgi:hypothetical protein
LPLWKESPPEEARPHVLPIDGTLTAEYWKWRESGIGQRVYHAFCLEAMTRMKLGAEYIGAKSVWEAIRPRFHQGCDNRFPQFVSRECVEEYPELKPYFKFRIRKVV